MLWRVLQANGGLPDEAIVCFANTGKEDEETLKFVQRCSVEWDVPIHWVEFSKDEPRFKVVSFETASRNGEPFAELINKKSYLPNPIARFCTEELKVKAINRFLDSIGVDADTMIGVHADEPRRIGKLRERGLLVPLVDAGVYQSDVQAFWNSAPFNLGLEFRNGVTALGNCDLCFNKSLGQIQSSISRRPRKAVWWIRQEEKVGATFAKDRPSYAAILKYVEDQGRLFHNNEEALACFCGD
jgi:hypothetical protein